MRIQVPRIIASSRRGNYLVGGSVRDLIQGLTPVDYDIAVSSDPRAFAEEAAKRNGGRVVLLGKDRFTVYRVASPQWNIDITTCKGRDIRQDLLARDFTINALACSLTDGRIIDVTGGLDDLHHGVVRMISPVAFQNDPARLVRAFRIAATMGFHIHPETIQAISACADLIGQTAGERIWSEFIRILACHDSHPHLQMMAQTEVLTAIFPELAASSKDLQRLSDAMEGMDHGLQAVQALERILREPNVFLPHKPAQSIETLDKKIRALLKMSLLMHAIGKPGCRRIGSDGRTHYYGHAARGAEMMQSIGRRLRMSNRHREFIASMVRMHQYPLFLYRSRRSDQLPPPEAVGRFFWIGGRQVPHLLILAMALDARRGDPLRSCTQGYMDFLRDIFATYCEKNIALGLPPILNGLDLIEQFKLQPSPLLGTLLRRLEELHLAGVITSRRQALEWVSNSLKSHNKNTPCPSGRGCSKHSA